MPRKIENPLEEGLISKIYLDAFSEYKTAYHIAEKDIGKPPSPGQVNREIKREEYSDLFDRKVEREKRKPIRSKAEPFIDKLEEDMEDSLLINEREEFLKFLGGSFRTAISKKYLKVNYDGHVNAYQNLLGTLLSLDGTEIAARDFKDACKNGGLLHTLAQGQGGGISFEDPRGLFEESFAHSFDKSSAYFEEPEIQEDLKDMDRQLLEKIMNVQPEGAMDLVKDYGRIGQNTLSQLENFLGNFQNL